MKTKTPVGATVPPGRFAGAGITFLVGAGVAHFHTIGTPVALTSIAFLIGLLLLPFGEETRGQVLPSYMRPALAVQMRELPENANGKVDRKAVRALLADIRS